MFRLLRELNNRDFTLYYYTAFSTSSCYIKLDQGVCGSIRIADHKGYDKYNYKFNLMIGLDKSYSEDGRNYYTLKDIDKMINDIVTYRNTQKEKYGFKYFEFMVKNKNDGENKKGFWEKAKNYNDKF